eukprot:2266591-Rhodomonas_salina.4
MGLEPMPVIRTPYKNDTAEGDADIAAVLHAISADIAAMCGWNAAICGENAPIYGGDADVYGGAEDAEAEGSLMAAELACAEYKVASQVPCPTSLEL